MSADLVGLTTGPMKGCFIVLTMRASIRAATALSKVFLSGETSWSPDAAAAEAEAEVGERESNVSMCGCAATIALLN